MSEWILWKLGLQSLVHLLHTLLYLLQLEGSCLEVWGERVLGFVEDACGTVAVIATTVASLAEAAEALLHDLDLRIYFGHGWLVVLV